MKRRRKEVRYLIQRKRGAPTTEAAMVKAKTRVVVLLALGVAMTVAFVGCSKKEPALKVVSPEVKRVVDDTKRYAESLKAQPAGDGVSAETIAKLTALLDQLLRHMEEKAHASQQGGDVAKPEAQLAEDLQQLQEVQSTLPAATGKEGTPRAAGQGEPILARISENLVKITAIVQQGKDLVAMVRPPADGAQASDSSQSSPASDTLAGAAIDSLSDASNPAALTMTAQGLGQLSPVTTGYDAVSMTAWPRANRLEVRTNGVIVGRYSATDRVDVRLDGFLKRGANTLTFTFIPPFKEGDVEVRLLVMPEGAGGDRPVYDWAWVEVLRFRPSKDHLEDTFELSFAGAKKQ
jgi:hypothetical protein